MQANTPISLTAPERFSTWQRILLTMLACVGTTAIATPLLNVLDLANIVMLFLLTVLLIAVTLGRNAAIWASVLSVLLFDIFFVPPRFSLAVNNIQYLVTFAVMLVTALITGQLAASLKQKAQEAQIREQQTQALYQLARQLAGTLTLQQVSEMVADFIKVHFKASSGILVPDANNAALTLIPQDDAARFEPHLAQIALVSGESVRSDEMGELGYASLYLPLRASMRIRGVLILAFGINLPTLERAEQALFEAVASLIAVAVERLHYVEVAQASELSVLSERLRSSILSALSHDLRTPLTALVGLADSLTLIKPALPAPALETAQAMHEQASRLAGLVANLLDMARLNAGQITLRREWQPLEEVVGASIKLLGNALAHNPIQVHFPVDLPLLEFDAVLIERVFCNLLENAAKYGPTDQPIEISATVETDCVTIRVRDHGPGFPTEQREQLFNMFVRGETESGKPGTGLGLAICRAIIEAHGGKISAEDAVAGGACVCFTLPSGNPPTIEEEPS
jgi:two-component system sensor histidine kinase KdpD